MPGSERITDFVVQWPRSLLRERLAALLNESKHDDAWAATVSTVLDDAFTTDAASRRFDHLRKQTADPWGPAGHTAAPDYSQRRNLGAAERFLATLLRRADDLPDPQTRRPYFSERRTGAGAAVLGRRAVAQEIDRIVTSLRSRGYLAMRFGDDCVDGDGHNDDTYIVDTQAGRPGLWPYTVDRLADPSEPDNLLDLIEVMHDLVAQPRHRWYHSYNGCGWHYSEFSIDAGQAVYRWNVNRILARSALDLTLSADGDDYGRLIVTTDENRTDLAHRMTHSKEPIAGDRVRHAIALYRQRGASEHDKRSACITLAGILEERRPELVANLHRKDEAAIFELMNRFAIRHQNEKQLDDYDPMFLDWVFWYYLATVELSDRLMQRTDRPATGPS